MTQTGSSASVRIGVLAPLSPPGWVGAGRHLVAGLDLAVRQVNGAGGVDKRDLELVVRDTAANPAAALAAVDELDALGVAALAGEYHSVVAQAAAARADAIGLPYLCSSAVLDELTGAPTDVVARLAPPQSRGWRLVAEHLLRAGHTRPAVVSQPSVYWAAGTRILREHLTAHGASLLEVAADPADPAVVRDALAAAGVSAAVLLVGHPEPVLPLVTALRRDRRLGGLVLVAPAGQPEFTEWAALGRDGAQVPFLRYLPEQLSALGARVDAQLRKGLGGPPSFVAFEGYDTGLVLAEALRTHGTDRARLVGCWPRLDVAGTRGRITFARVACSGVWQWADAPIQLVDRDPAEPDRFRVLAQH